MDKDEGQTHPDSSAGSEPGAISRSEKEPSAEEKEKKERAREEFNLHEADYRRNPQG